MALSQKDAARRERVLALTHEVMIEHAWTLERLASCDPPTTLPDGNPSWGE